MILTTILMSMTAIAGIGLLATFWDDLVDFAKETVRKISQALSQAVVAGVKVFLKKVGEAIQEIIKSYIYDQKNDRWEEKTTTRDLPEDEVPLEYREKVHNNGQEVDMTEKLELQMSN